jgi:uncharacterized membrane protein
MRRGRFTVGGYIIMGLIAIGLLVSLKTLFIPIIVFAVIFLLYKFPPSRWGMRTSTPPGRRTASTKRRSKDATFRVITGNKNTDTDDRPKYH